MGPQLKLLTFCDFVPLWQCYVVLPMLQLNYHEWGHIRYWARLSISLRASQNKHMEPQEAAKSLNAHGPASEPWLAAESWIRSSELLQQATSGTNMGPTWAQINSLWPTCAHVSPYGPVHIGLVDLLCWKMYHYSVCAIVVKNYVLIVAPIFPFVYI